MALFIIERGFAEQLQMEPETVQQITDVNEEIGINWIFSFLSADQKKTYCLYEAKDPDELRAQAQVLGIPTDVIVEVTKIDPTAMLAPAG